MPKRDADWFVAYGESYTLQRERFNTQKMDMEAVKQELDVSTPWQSQPVELCSQYNTLLLSFSDKPY